MKKKITQVSPIVKWVGGKRQLLNVLAPLLPHRYAAYCEPFLGGGALLFRQRPEVAYINDVNAELINVYQVIRDSAEALIADLRRHQNEAAYYYSVRDWDRDPRRFDRLTPVKRASRIIYLNKTCYNGLFRVNSAGEFNTPFGSYKNPNIVNADAIRAVSRYFNEAKVRITQSDYADVLRLLPSGTFVYLDPPYHPVSDTANFTGYTKGGFDRDEQKKLKERCDALNKRKIKFMLSNSATPFILDLYKDYRIDVVRAKRAINSAPNKRGDVEEVVVRNYE